MSADTCLGLASFDASNLRKILIALENEECHRGITEI